MEADKIRRGLDRFIDWIVEDILEMSDEEILAECIEDGEDPEQIAEEMRALIEKAIKRAKEQQP